MVDDSTALFHANHGNLATVAFSAAEWAAARKRLFSQTVPGTGSKLGLWPTFALLPVDLYDTALEVFGYGTGDVGKPNSGGTAQTVNPYGESRLGDPRPIPIVVPEWTDATDWAQIVDPRLHPVIQMAYAVGAAGRPARPPRDLRSAQSKPPASCSPTTRCPSRSATGGPTASPPTSASAKTTSPPSSFRSGWSSRFIRSIHLDPGTPHRHSPRNDRCGASRGRSIQFNPIRSTI